MRIILLTLVIAAAPLIGCQTAQEKTASSAPTILTADQQQGFLTGRWTSEVSARWSGTLKIAIDANQGSPDFTGQIQFGESSCIQWKPFTGSVSANNTVTIESDLGAPCGKVVVKAKHQGGQLSGSYSAEYPDNGKIVVH